MTATYQPLSVPRRNPTADQAIRRADGHHPRGERRGGVRYDAGVRVRRGKEPLTVTLLDAVKWPLRWQATETIG